MPRKQETIRQIDLGYDVHYEETKHYICHSNGEPMYMTGIESEIKW